MKTHQIALIVLFLGIMLISCTKEEQGQMILINQSLTIEDISNLEDSAFTIGSLIQYTNLSETPPELPILHENETITVIGKVNYYDIHLNSFVMRDIPDRNSINSNEVKISIVGNRDVLFTRIISKVQPDSTRFHDVIVIGRILSQAIEQNGKLKKVLYLETDDFILPEIYLNGK